MRIDHFALYVNDLEATKDFYATFKMRAGNHAEVLVAKGIPGIGTQFRVASVPQGGEGTIRNFVTSFMATENGTTVQVSDYNTSVVFTSASGNITANTQNFNLNKGQTSWHKSIQFRDFTFRLTGAAQK